MNQNILDSNTIPDGSPPKVQKIEDQPKWIRLAWENKNVALMPGDSIVIESLQELSMLMAPYIIQD